jgi:hypothetical protein
MKIKVKNPDKWIFPKEWLEALKSEFNRQLPSRKICLIIENKKQEDYIFWTKDSGLVLVYVSVNNCVRNEIITIFKNNYLTAVVEHEVKHLQPNINFYINKIIAPSILLAIESRDFYEHITRLLNIKFQDFLTDVYANSGMTIGNLKKYLEFETSKICSTWASMDKVGQVRTPFMLFMSYVEACYKAINENLPSELYPINACFQDDYSNIAIHKQMVEVYLELWKALKLGKTDIDLKEKTSVLQELIKRQPNPFL